MSDVPDSLSDCLQSVRQPVVSRAQGRRIVGRVHTVLLLREAIGGQPVEVERSQKLRDRESGL